MHIIVCVDDRMGMLFNNRRQSRDRVVREDMLLLIGEQKLWVSPYTARQFADVQQNQLLVAEDFLEQAGKGEYCFVEDVDVTPYIHCVEQIIVYHWKRAYPADTYFTVDLSEFQLKEYCNLTGSSHPDMIKEIYTKKAEERKEEEIYEE